MKKFADFVVDKRYIIFAIFVILLVASIVAIFFVPINSDIMSYLPDGLTMTEGLNFMQSNFGMQSEVLLGIDNVNYEDMKKVTGEISKLEGVKPGGLLWIGTIVDMQNMKSSDMMAGLSLQEMLKAANIINKIDGMSINGTTVYIDGVEMTVFLNDLSSQMLENQSMLNIFYPNEDENGEIYFDPDAKAKYMCMLQLNVASSDDTAMNLLKSIDKIMVNNNIPKSAYSVGGDAPMVKDIFDSTINEMYKYILVAFLVMFIVLLLTTTSFIEPVIFMLTIGISIIVNMGTNIIFKDVSIVTFACSAVLQLGLSMDYSIFLMHAFSEEKRKTLDEHLAMKRAIPKTFASVTASALTTVGGFLALFVMRFEIGVDLGKVLAKGVFLSLVTVILLQPCLMLMTSKLTKKTSHKIFLPKFKGVAKFSISYRRLIVIVAVLILIPSIVLQSLEGDRLSYIKFVDTPKIQEGTIQDKVAKVSNSVITMIPYGDAEKNDELLEKLDNIDGVTQYMNMNTMIPEEYKDRLNILLANDELMAIMSKSKSMSMMSGFVSNGYTLCQIMIDAESESDRERVVLENITKALDEVYGKNPPAHSTILGIGKKDDVKYNYYLTGMSQAVQDLRSITPQDNMLVTILSILVILIILIITQKSIKLPVVLIALIEFGIFINLALCYITGEEINFMCYIILSSIQLGSTVDYAILYTDKYQSNLTYMPANEAAYKALRDSAASILTSVAIMAGCCLSVTLVATNTIVKQITWLIARGSIISGILTIVVLPALLVVFTGNKKLKKRGVIAAKELKVLEKVEKIDQKEEEQAK